MICEKYYEKYIKILICALDTAIVTDFDVLKKLCIMNISIMKKLSGDWFASLYSSNGLGVRDFLALRLRHFFFYLNFDIFG